MCCIPPTYFIFWCYVVRTYKLNYFTFRMFVELFFMAFKVIQHAWTLFSQYLFYTSFALKDKRHCLIFYCTIRMPFHLFTHPLSHSLSFLCTHTYIYRYTRTHTTITHLSICFLFIKLSNSLWNFSLYIFLVLHFHLVHLNFKQIHTKLFLSSF